MTRLPCILRAVWIAATLFAATLVVSMGELDAAEDAATDALRVEVERLRGELELVYLQVAEDHAKVRDPQFAQALPAPVADGLREMVAAARAADAPPADEVAATGLSKIGRERGLPLSAHSLRVVLCRTAALARESRESNQSNESHEEAVPLFVSAARDVFRSERVEDAWDASFLDLPAVAAWRDANQRLADALRAPLPPEGPPPDAVPDDLAGMVFFDKARAWVGPWSGWTDDVDEKDNRRQRKQLKAYWMDRHEVTCARYRDFVSSQPASERAALLPQGWALADDGTVSFPEGRDRHPVTGVTWRQAQAFAEALGKRLPTADERDRVAGGGEKEPRLFPWGNDEQAARWHHIESGPEEPSPVDAWPEDATPEGVLGLAGNVAEMVATAPDGSDLPRTGPEKGGQSIVCGGHFRSRASECTTSWRWVLDADAAAPTIGFRCVMDDAEYRKRGK